MWHGDAASYKAETCARWPALRPLSDGRRGGADLLGQSDVGLDLLLQVGSGLEFLLAAEPGEEFKSEAVAVEIAGEI